MRNTTRSKLTPHDETLIRELYADGMIVAEIASKFEVSSETIRRAIKRKSWTDVKKSIESLDQFSYVAVEALEKIIRVPYNDAYSAKEIAWVALRKLRDMR